MEDDEEPIEEAAIINEPEEEKAELEAEMYAPQPEIVEPKPVVVSQPAVIEKEEP
jgi:hypothetical protein